MIVSNRSGASSRLQYEIQRLERLLKDLKAIQAGSGPSADELAEAPVFDQYVILRRPVPCLAGEVLGHPRLPGGPTISSDLWVIDPEAGWARTLSRYYTLGRILDEDGSTQ